MAGHCRASAHRQARGSAPSPNFNARCGDMSQDHKAGTKLRSSKKPLRRPAGAKGQTTVASYQNCSVPRFRCSALKPWINFLACPCSRSASVPSSSHQHSQARYPICFMRLHQNWDPDQPALKHHRWPGKAHKQACSTLQLGVGSLLRPQRFAESKTHPFTPLAGSTGPGGLAARPGGCRAAWSQKLPKASNTDNVSQHRTEEVYYGIL